MQLHAKAGKDKLQSPSTRVERLHAERSFCHIYQSKKSVALLTLVCVDALQKWLTVWKLNRQREGCVMDTCCMTIPTFIL